MLVCLFYFCRKCLSNVKSGMFDGSGILPNPTPTFGLYSRYVCMLLSLSFKSSEASFKSSLRSFKSSPESFKPGLELRVANTRCKIVVRVRVCDSWNHLPEDIVTASLLGLWSIRPRVDPPRVDPPQGRSFRPRSWVVLPQRRNDIKRRRAAQIQNRQWSKTI